MCPVDWACGQRPPRVRSSPLRFLTFPFVDPSSLWGPILLSHRGSNPLFAATRNDGHVVWIHGLISLLLQRILSNSNLQGHYFYLTIILNFAPLIQRTCGRSGEWAMFTRYARRQKVKLKIWMLYTVKAMPWMFGLLNSLVMPVNLLSRYLTFRRRIKTRLPFAGIIRRLPYSTRFQDKG